MSKDNAPKELLVISGKGGTGKTSLTAAFALLAGRGGRQPVLADCDVDAADLHLILLPTTRQRETFLAGHEARVREGDCVRCGACYTRCRFGAIAKGAGGAGEAEFIVDPLACEGCGVCVQACPVGAIDFPVAECGEWFVSGTRAGTMIHARLNAGGENSGKLVSLVRKQAAESARQSDADLVIIDGPPGVGCPVIASLGGVSFALVVTEPTVSGFHDMARVLDLAKHFSVPAAVCVNKWDINPEQAAAIEALAESRGAKLAGRIRYARGFTEALRAGRAVTECTQTDEQKLLAAEAEDVWNRVKGLLDE